MTGNLTEICSFCHKIITMGSPESPTSHGLCWKCAEQHFPDQCKAMREKCDHEFEQVDIDHETSGYPSGYNYKTEQITETTYRTHAKTEQCLTCGLKVERPWEDCDCDDGPDDPPERERDEYYDEGPDVGDLEP